MRKFTILLVIIGLLLSVITATVIGSDYFSVQDNPNEEIKIRLKIGSFDPLIESLDMPDDLRLKEPNSYYIVQCNGRIQPGWINQLKAKGAKIHGYLPDYAYVVQTETTEKLVQLPFVRWIGPFHPAYKIDPNLNGKDGEIDLNVAVFGWSDNTENLENVTGELRRLGCKIVYDGADDFFPVVKVDASLINDIAFIPEVRWIDESGEKVTCMNNVREYIGANYVHIEGFDGTGIIGEVKDDGIDLDHPDFGNIIGIHGSPPDAAHGTSSYGTVFSTGNNNINAKGMLPNAEGVFCSWNISRLNSVYRLITYWNGLFQCNAWVQAPANGEYSSACEQDDICVITYDLSMLYSVGNYGNTGPQSISPDAAAKNVISVGGILHYDNDIKEDDEWAAPSAIGLPGYGPTADGRVKPDLCGPYEDIYTTDSPDYDADWGYRTGDYVTIGSDNMFGGTSAATAVVSGCVGIIYQMYKENLFDNNPSGEIPHASTVKALLIADAYQYDFTQATRYQQGWGTPDLHKTLDIADGHFIINEDTALQTGESINYYFTPEDTLPLKVTIVWTDYPAFPNANPTLVNNLNLKVTAPDASIYWGNYGLDTSKWSVTDGVPDILNNVENVFIETPQSGEWTIEVIAENIALDGHSETSGIVDQDFALVATTKQSYVCVDTDGDGYGDPGHPENECPVDNCPYIYNPNQEDIDADSIGDSCDNCIYVYNPEQMNADGDSLGDACDYDDDDDDVTDSLDNCPTVYNPEQEDCDGDDIGDACDSCDCYPGDMNGDCIVNIFDITHTITYLYLNGAPPIPYELCDGDPNRDCTCNIFDITYLIAYLYLDGPPPCTCEDWLTECGPPLRR